jgi:hypothetical protein
MNFVKDMGVNDHFQVSHLFFSEGLIGYALQNFIYVKFDKYDPSPYIFKKVDMNVDVAAWPDISEFANHLKSHKTTQKILNIGSL